MDSSVRAYIEAIPDDVRPLFDRVHGLLMAEHPEAQVVLSYKMPTYVVGERRLHVGAWKHGLSLYGWEDRVGFVDRHPELDNGKGTLRLPSAVAAGIADDELRDLLRSTLAP